MRGLAGTLGLAVPASSLLALLQVLPQAGLHMPVQSLEMHLSFYNDVLDLPTSIPSPVYQEVQA